ncbi:chaplin [Streptomyces sp. A1499]|uniref:chaplin n=1 Tax=Streptomyces sp. A1499 TaxID=2563104 RepID=UPI00109E5779|nr:chaplin [Streptomyces sp. A1499]THC45615.1 chaplin [Streptomyces sp. A1499]
MRQVTRKGLTIMAAATGVLAVTGGHAHADAGAGGSSSNSPGVLSGNSVQIPVDAPVNVCGNTVNVVGVLNPAAGNACVNHGSGNSHKPSGGSDAHGHASDSPGVGSGNSVQLPVHAPVNVCGNSVTIGGLANPASGNDCANESDGPSKPPGHEHPPEPEPEQPGEPEEPGNPGEPGEPGEPGKPEKPGKPENPVERPPGHPGTPIVTPPKGGSQLTESGDDAPVTNPGPAKELAETGSSLPLGLTLPASAGALLAGAVLYRRARAAA